ncbi:MAG: ABC transporter ATP-binding protein [Planctomycetaceae bacterium]|nr:ABC transporter ATP-binding protein [Planctomycetaceae bacterium]
MIELKDVTIAAGDFRLTQLSFCIETGEHVALMGRTGRGKTTILEAICGLRRIDSGAILIHGVDVTDWSPRDRQVGYVPQDLALFPTLTVREHLAFALEIRKVSASGISERVNELSDLLGIRHLLARRIQGLSGGESQRVALGRALSFRPTVLLLDEPLSALDQETRLEMQTLLQSLKTTAQVTTLHVTHSEEEANLVADRRLILTDGRVMDT